MSSSYDQHPRARRMPNRGTEVDMHEALKREIYTQGADPATQAPTGAISAVPTAGFEDTELYFDSTRRNASSSLAAGEMFWSVPVLNNSNDIKNCVEMSISPFYFPKIIGPTTAPEYFYFRRMYLEFQGAPSTQGVLADSGNRFHFEFEIQNINGYAVKLIPLNTAFFYQRPMVAISDFQVRFLVPPTIPGSPLFKRVPLPQETVTIQSLLTGGIGYNPIRFSIMGGPATNILGPVGAFAAPGLAVFIAGYTSNDAATNTAVNNTDGIYITNIIDSASFEIAGINAAAVTAQYTATMFIPKNRIAFRTRFTSVRDIPTNYVSVVHT